MLDNNIAHSDGQFHIEFYIDGKEIFNSNYRAVDVPNAISGTTRVTFQCLQEYRDQSNIYYQNGNCTISKYIN